MSNHPPTVPTPELTRENPAQAGFSGENPGAKPTTTYELQLGTESTDSVREIRLFFSRLVSQTRLFFIVRDLSRTRPEERIFLVYWDILSRALESNESSCFAVSKETAIVT